MHVMAGSANTSVKQDLRADCQADKMKPCKSHAGAGHAAASAACCPSAATAALLPPRSQASNSAIQLRNLSAAMRSSTAYTSAATARRDHRPGRCDRRSRASARVHSRAVITKLFTGLPRATSTALRVEGTIGVGGEGRVSRAGLGSMAGSYPHSAVAAALLTPPTVLAGPSMQHQTQTDPRPMTLRQAGNRSLHAHLRQSLVLSSSSRGRGMVRSRSPISRAYLQGGSRVKMTRALCLEGWLVKEKKKGLGSRLAFHARKVKQAGPSANHADQRRVPAHSTATHCEA